jgi:hypothetical protein
LIDKTTPVKYNITILINTTTPVKYKITTLIENTTPVKYKVNNGDYVPQNHSIPLRYHLFFMRGTVLRNQ